MYYIYKITNLVNGKTYIGQHKYEKLDDYYMGSGKHLINAQKKYGIENFKKEILIFNVAKKEHIDLLEKTFIASERKKVGPENCYNITDGGEGGNGGLNKGHHHSEETKRKISEANKGKHHSEETRRKISESQKGENHNFYGKHLSEETKKKISKAMKGNQCHKGHLHSKEAKKKMSEAHKGNQYHKGCHLSDETKNKISESIKGKHWKLVDGKRVWY